MHVLPALAAARDDGAPRVAEAVAFVRVVDEEPLGGRPRAVTAAFGQGHVPARLVVLVRKLKIVLEGGRHAGLLEVPLRIDGESGVFTLVGGYGSDPEALVTALRTVRGRGLAAGEMGCALPRVPAVYFGVFR